MPSGSRSPRRRNASPPRQKRRSSSSPSSPSSPSRRSPKRSGSRGGDRSYPPPFRRESEVATPSAKLFVTNIDSRFTKEELDVDLRALFEPFGAIKDIVVKTKSGSNNSYCFIQYEKQESAAKAQEDLKGKDFKGKELKVEFGRGERKNEDRRSDKCYICHKEGHFAKDCKYNRYTGSAYRDERPRRDDRDVRDRDREKDRDRDRDDYRDRKHRKRSYSRSNSSSRSYRRKHDRDDYRRRDRERERYSPEKRSSHYHSSRRY